MNGIVPSARVTQDYLNRKNPEGFSPAKQKPAHSKIQDVVVRSCITLSQSGLFVSASSPEVVLGQIPAMELAHRGKLVKKRRHWNKRRAVE
jgi:hypothetical protein